MDTPYSLGWFTRRVLVWRVSITPEVDFCIEAVEEVRARHSKPEIFNTDQGSQFTSIDFIKVLTAREIKTSMDGKGVWRDNIFAERLWWSQIRESLTAGLRKRLGSVRGDRQVSWLLQQPPPAFIASWQNPEQAYTSTYQYPKPQRHNRGGTLLRKHSEPVQTNRTISIQAMGYASFAVKFSDAFLAANL